MAELTKSSFGGVFWKLLNDHGYYVEATKIPTCIATFFQEVTKYLREEVKKDGKAHAVTMHAKEYNKDKEDDNNPVVFAATLEKVADKDDDEESYNLQYAFDDSIVNESMTVEDLTDENVYAFIVNHAFQDFDAVFKASTGVSGMHAMYTVMRDAFFDYFRDNINSDPELSFKDYFTMKGTVVDGKVKVSITPSEIMKQLVKADDKKAAA